MNLTQLRVLVAVADTGSITHAAERIGLTQSGASQSISTLEEHLGVHLTVRERRGMSLTAIGEDVVTHARDVLAGLDDIRRIADAAHGLEQGRVWLASFPSVLTTLLPPLLQRFNARHPGIEVLALEATDTEVAALLADGTADIGVVMTMQPGRVGIPLYRDEWVAVVPVGHKLSRTAGRRVSLDVLVREPFIVATGGCSTHARTVAREAGLELIDVRVEVHDWASAFAMVREGLGVSLAPALSLPGDKRGLRILDLDQPVYRELALEVSPHSAQVPAVRALLDAAATICTQVPARTKASV